MSSFSINLEPVESQYCECTVDYSEEGISGYQTKMTYIGNAKFKCPKCGAEENMLSDTYKVRLQFKKDKGCADCSKDGKDCGDAKCKASMTVKILEPNFDPRLLTKWEPDSTGTIQESLQEDLDEWADEDFESFHFASHPEGVFDVELLYNYYRTCYEYEEYDMNLRIIAEAPVQFISNQSESKQA
jgi:hypothetical protein